jgi:hypothetical protein
MTTTQSMVMPHVESYERAQFRNERMQMAINAIRIARDTLEKNRFGFPYRSATPHRGVNSIDPFMELLNVMSFYYTWTGGSYDELNIDERVIEYWRDDYKTQVHVKYDAAAQHMAQLFNDCIGFCQETMNAYCYNDTLRPDYADRKSVDEWRREMAHEIRLLLKYI